MFLDISSSSFKRLIDARTVRKLVNIPPNQRWLTKGIPQRSASALTASLAARLVPTNMTLPLLDATLPIKLMASLAIGMVCSRLIIWILLRSPKIKAAILGFQKRVW